MSELTATTQFDIHDIDRFWSAVNRDAGADSCWLWTRSVLRAGYEQIVVKGRHWLVHRFVYTIIHGPIPEGLTVDHVCHVRTCVNPVHLRLLSARENSRITLTLLRTHCPRGHAYDLFNTYVDPKGHRRCRACARIRYLAKAGSDHG